MRSQSVEHNEFAPRRTNLPRVRAVRFGCATVLLMFGALLVRISNACTALGVLWAGDTTARALAKAVAHTRQAEPISTHAPHWERQLLRIGPSLIIGVGGVLLTFLALLGIGGALMLLVLHGYGLLLMLLAVLVGVLVGGRRAKIGRLLPPSDRLN